MYLKNIVSYNNFDAHRLIELSKLLPSGHPIGKQQQQKKTNCKYLI